MTEPCELSALEARRLIGRKRLSPIELLESCIARIEMVNASVNVCSFENGKWSLITWGDVCHLDTACRDSVKLGPSNDE